VFERLLSVERNELGLGNGNGGYRRVSPIAVWSGEGPLTEPTATAQIREREALFMPHMYGPAAFRN